MFEDHIANRDLTIASQRNNAIAPNAKNSGAVNGF